MRSLRPVQSYGQRVYGEGLGELALCYGDDTAHPWRFGPTLLGSPAPTVWHCAQRVLKSPAPFFASPGIHHRYHVIEKKPSRQSLILSKDTDQGEHTGRVGHIYSLGINEKRNYTKVKVGDKIVREQVLTTWNLKIFCSDLVRLSTYHVFNNENRSELTHREVQNLIVLKFWFL